MTGSVSLFDDTVEWHMSQGMSKKFATHRAIDDYRKHTKRQVQGETFDILCQTTLSSRTPSADDVLEINQIFEKLVHDVSEAYVRLLDRERVCKLVCCMFRMHALDELLYDDNLAFVDTLLGDFYPEEEHQIGAFLGYKVSPGNKCVPMSGWKHKIAAMAGKYSLYTGSRDIRLIEDVDSGVRAYA